MFSHRKLFILVFMLFVLVACNKDLENNYKENMIYYNLNVEDEAGNDIIKEIELQTVPLNRDKISDGYKFFYNIDGVSITMDVKDIMYKDDLSKVKNNLKYFLYNDGYKIDDIKTESYNFTDVTGVGAYVYDEGKDKLVLKNNVYLSNGVLAKIVVEANKDVATIEDLRTIVLGDLVKVLKSIVWVKDKER